MPILERSQIITVVGTTSDFQQLITLPFKPNSVKLTFFSYEVTTSVDTTFQIRSALFNGGFLAFAAKNTTDVIYSHSDMEFILQDWSDSTVEFNVMNASGAKNGSTGTLTMTLQFNKYRYSKKEQVSGYPV